MTVLREWSAEDGDWYVAQLDDPEIQAFTVESPDTSAAQFRLALETANQSPDHLARAIMADDELAGNLAAYHDGSEAVVSYWVATTHRHRGLATRALQECCEWIEHNWPEVTRVVLTIKPGNTGSERVAERTGFARDPAYDRIVTVRGEDWTMQGFSRASGSPG